MEPPVRKAAGSGAPVPRGVSPRSKRNRRELERGIPRTPSPSALELDAVAPPRQRYPVSVLRSLGELVRTRELLFTFVERDLRVRYKQAVLGGLWAIVQPLVIVVIFTVIFERIARIPVGAPYPVFAYTALSAWGFFSGSITYATNGVISSGGVVRKVFFPREVLPLTAVFSSAFDYVASLPILLVMLLAYGYTPGRTWLATPLLLGILTMMAAAAALVVSAITVYYRDTRYGVPTLMQLVLFATPIAYPLDRARQALPKGLSSAYEYLNPLAPVMDGLRRTLLFGRWPDWGPTLVSAAVAALALGGSYAWYKRVDPTFADVI